MHWRNGRANLLGLAGLVAIASLLAGCAAETPAYLRIAVSAKSVVYLQLQRDEIRAAMSTEALPMAETARVYSASNQPQIEIEQPVPLEIMPAPRFALKLPIPAAELPAGLTAIRASFLDGVLALTLCRLDDRKVAWLCLGYRTGLAAADAPAVQVPDPAKIALAVTGVPSRGKLGIGLNLVSGPCTMYLMRMDGKGIAAHVRVVDEAGKEVASLQGTLDDFSSACDGPCRSVPAAKGVYTMEATVEAGPFGGTLKTETKVVVP